LADFSEQTLNRIKVLAASVSLICAVLLLRLWIVQGLNGSKYLAEAEENRIKEVELAAPRGIIYDRQKKMLVKNRLAISLAVEPAAFKNKRLLKKLSQTLNMPLKEIKAIIASKRFSPLAPRVIKRDLPMSTLAFIKEHQEEFKGAEIKEEAVREYPYGSLAAHVLGYVGEVSRADLKTKNKAAYSPNDLIGKEGLEKQYEDVLRGAKGREFVEVNAVGTVVRLIAKREPESGNSIVLSLDKDIQQYAEEALPYAFNIAKKNKYPKANAGAVVVLQPQTCEVVALASYPTYNPSSFINGISTSEWQQLLSAAANYPLTNRAIQSAYPPGSTFKVVTAVAGLNEGSISTGSTVVCRGRWVGLGQRWAKWCWNKAGHGAVSLEKALAVSCDSFFYEVGLRLDRKSHQQLSFWAKKLGLGKPTGIDLPGEAGGWVPDPEWKKSFNKNWPENQPWFPGDTVNMAIGQGDILLTPLQLAYLYAAIANGGTFYRPYIVKEVTGTDGRLAYQAQPKKVGQLPLSTWQLAVIRRGLRRVVSEGTAAGAFANFKTPVAGKTGTSEVAGKDDYAFFVAFAPFDNPQYVVAVVVEQGGHGGSTAAPAARYILAKIFNEPPTTSDVKDFSR